MYLRVTEGGMKIGTEIMLHFACSYLIVYKLGVSNENMVCIFRLGRRTEPNEQMRPRPVMVQFGSYSAVIF